MASGSGHGHFQKVRIQRDNTIFDAYVTGKANASGIVVLHEWWGVDFEIKNHALHIAQMHPGYRTLIPDFYHGKVASSMAEAERLMKDLDWLGAVEEIRASVNWLKVTGSSKIGVTGYGMGGALAIASAVLVPEVDAVVAFYGVGPTYLADPALAKAPVQAHFGELDKIAHFSDATVAETLVEQLKSSGVPHKVHIYPGCGHAFMDASPDGIKRRKAMGMNDEDFAAVTLAWSRFSAWMGHYLLSP